MKHIELILSMKCLNKTLTRLRDTSIKEQSMPEGKSADRELNVQCPKGTSRWPNQNVPTKP